MKLKLTGLIIMSLFINLFSSFAVNAQENDAIASAALDNTMNAAKTFFVSYCVTATLDIVMGKIALQKTMAQKEKSRSKDSKTAKDLGQVFFVQTVSGYSLNLLSAKACTDFGGSIATVAKDIQFSILLTKFLHQFYVFLILLSMLYLLPRGSIDNYAILNKIYRHV